MKCFRSISFMTLVGISFLFNMGCDGSSSSGDTSTSTATLEQVEMLKAWTDLYFKFGKEDQASPALYAQLEEDDTISNFKVSASDSKDDVNTASKIATNVCTFAGFPEVTPIIKAVTTVADAFLPDQPSPEQEALDNINKTLDTIQTELGNITTAINKLGESQLEQMDEIIDEINNLGQSDNKELYSTIVNPIQTLYATLDKYYDNTTNTAKNPSGFWENELNNHAQILESNIQNLTNINPSITPQDITTICNSQIDPDTYNTIINNGAAVGSASGYIDSILTYKMNNLEQVSLPNDVLNNQNIVGTINTHDVQMTQFLLYNLKVLEEIYVIGCVALMEQNLAYSQKPEQGTDLYSMANWEPNIHGILKTNDLVKNLQAFGSYWLASVKVFIVMVAKNYFITDIDLQGTVYYTDNKIIQKCTTGINCNNYDKLVTDFFKTAIATGRSMSKNSLPGGDWTQRCIFYRPGIFNNSYSGVWDGDTLTVQIAPITMLSSGDNPCVPSKTGVQEASLDYSNVCNANSNVISNYIPTLSGYPNTPRVIYTVIIQYIIALQLRWLRIIIFYVLLKPNVMENVQIVVFIFLMIQLL